MTSPFKWGTEPEQVTVREIGENKKINVWKILFIIAAVLGIIYFLTTIKDLAKYRSDRDFYSLVEKFDHIDFYPGYTCIMLGSTVTISLKGGAVYDICCSQPAHSHCILRITFCTDAYDSNTCTSDDYEFFLPTKKSKK
jgi:hypothetical protein